MTEKEEIELLALLEQEQLEKVSPKIEQFRNPAMNKVACGGRGAGAKSWSVASLLVQKHHRKKYKWFCGREIQKTLEESSYSLIWETIQRLNYPGWIKIPSRSRIVNTQNGSYFYFGGLKDESAAKGKKGLEGYDGCWIDEAEDIAIDIWDIILPTFRKENSEVWVTFNRNKETDPAYKLFFVNKPPKTIAIELEPGKIDNPWFPERLEIMLQHDYKTRPDIAEHIWGGKPKQQGEDSVLSRVLLRQAMRRTVPAVGAIEIGVDVARFGDDDTEMWKRKGFKIIDKKTFHGRDTQFIAKEVWSFANRDPSIPIKVDDTGLGGGVSDRLKDLGAKKVVMIHFGGTPSQQDKYTTVADEMWFDFPIEEADIPDDDELFDQLSDRRYDYDKQGRRKIESKDKYKERNGKSPDKADGMLLCFYTGKHLKMDHKAREALKRRRQ